MSKGGRKLINPLVAAQNFGERPELAVSALLRAVADFVTSTRRVQDV